MKEIWDYLWKAFIVICLARYAWVLAQDFIGMFNYLRAGVYNGRVLKSLGTVEVAALLSGRSTYYHTFENYQVEYDFNGQRLQGNVLTARKNLKSGDPLPVHIINNNGVLEIQTDTHGAKIKFMTLIILCAVLGTLALVAFFYFHG